MTGCTHGAGPWATAPQAVVLGYGGVLAARAYAPVTQPAITVITALAEYGVRLVLAGDSDVEQPHARCMEQLRLAGVSWCFDAVLETVHHDIRAPDPRFFAATLNQINCVTPGGDASGVVWVATSAAHEIIPAIQHGMRAVWVSHSDDPRLTAIPQVRRIETISRLPLALGLPVCDQHACAGARRTRSPSEGQRGLPRPRRPLPPDQPGDEYA